LADAGAGTDAGAGAATQMLPFVCTVATLLQRRKVQARQYRFRELTMFVFALLEFPLL